MTGGANPLPPPGPLSGVRVLELASEIGQFCGKLLADFGADVITIEPPGGHPTRSIGPFLDDVAHPERSLYFWHYNTSKRGVTLDLMEPEGNALFRRLASTADVILETSPPGYLPFLELSYDQLSQDNPGLIMCSLTPFGQTGPWRHFDTSDLLHLAAGGQMASCGYDPDDVPDAPPIAPGGGNAWHAAGHYAYMGILAALFHRGATGQGQYIDASVHDACALTTEGAVPTYIYSGDVVLRHTGRAASPDMSERTQFRTKDGGWINITRSGSTLTPARIRALAQWMDTFGLAEDLTDGRFQDIAAIQRESAHINEVLARFFAQMPVDQAWHGGQRLGFPWGAIRSMDEILDDEHLQDRSFFVQVDHPEQGRSYTYPGPAAIYGDAPWRISRRAPLIGEHNQEIFCNDLGLTPEELARLSSSGVV